MVAIGAEAQGIFAFGQQAHGIFAFGQIATGVVAFGQLSTGVIAVGQLARGGIAVGQGALGLVAMGQVAVGVGWAAGMGIGGTAGPLVVYGLYGRLRRKQLADGMQWIRIRLRHRLGRVRGMVQDAVPLWPLTDRRPWTRRRVASTVFRALGLAVIGAIWWVAAGQAMIQAAAGGS